MIGVLVTSHGNLCQELLNSLVMITGENHNILALKFDDYNNYKNELTMKLNIMISDYDGILIFTDIIGGTPFNESYKYVRESNKNNIKIITGVNLPMIIETTLALSHEDNLNNLVNIAVDAGKGSINCVC